MTEKSKVSLLDSIFTIREEIDEKLHKVISDAMAATEEAMYTVTTEDLGPLLIGVTEEGKIFFTPYNGGIEVAGDWTMSFEELAKEMSDNLITHEEGHTLVAGLRKAADLLEQSLRDEESPSSMPGEE